MKKFFGTGAALVLCLLFALFMFAGCDGGADSASDGNGGGGTQAGGNAVFREDMSVEELLNVITTMRNWTARHTGYDMTNGKKKMFEYIMKVDGTNALGWDEDDGRMYSEGYSFTIDNVQYFIENREGMQQQTVKRIISSDKDYYYIDEAVNSGFWEVAQCSHAKYVVLSMIYAIRSGQLVSEGGKLNIISPDTDSEAYFVKIENNRLVYGGQFYEIVNGVKTSIQYHEYEIGDVGATTVDIPDAIYALKDKCEWGEIYM